MGARYKDESYKNLKHARVPSEVNIGLFCFLFLLHERKSRKYCGKNKAREILPEVGFSREFCLLMQAFTGGA